MSGYYPRGYAGPALVRAGRLTIAGKLLEEIMTAGKEGVRLFKLPGQHVQLIKGMEHVGWVEIDVLPWEGDRVLMRNRRAFGRPPGKGALDAAVQSMAGSPRRWHDLDNWADAMLGEQP